jgi:hypothetical protein
MSVPPVPPPLQELGQRPFSFYPPIVGIEHNDWLYGKATWSEIQVTNRKSGVEVYIPRVYVGELSRIDEPVAIVGLNKELEYKAGAVVPHVRRVIQMPRAVNDVARPAVQTEEFARLAPVVGIRLEHKSDSKIGRLLLAVTAVAVIGVVAVVALFQGGSKRVSYSAVMQSDIQFSSNDDYYSVVNRLGVPSDDRWRSAQGELQYRLLAYPKLNTIVILMGSERGNAHYIGQLNRDWRVIHSTDPNTEAMLRQLRKF